MRFGVPTPTLVREIAGAEARLGAEVTFWVIALGSEFRVPRSLLPHDEGEVIEMQFELVVIRLDWLVVMALLGLPATGQSSLRCWGVNGYDTEGRQGRFTQVDATYAQTAVLRSDGRIFVNGQNAGGALLAPLPPAGMTYKQVAISNYGGAALRSDGLIDVWGIDVTAIGMPASFPPAPTPPSGLNYVQVAAGGRHILAIRSDGAIVAWGSNSQGECNVPTLPPGVNAIRVCAEYDTSYAILSDGSLIAWGENGLGQLQIPALPPGVAYRDVKQSNTHCVALRSDGECVAWGGVNQYGERNVPPLPPGLTYDLASAGMGNTFLVRSDGVLLAWGENSWGQCNVPVMPAGETVIQIDSGADHTTCLLSNGKVVSWGDNAFDCAFQPQLPDRMPGLPAAWYGEFARGTEYTLAVTSDGEIQAWGNNQATQCNVPSSLSGRMISRLKTQMYHVGALLRDGNLVCWGDNSVGQCNVPLLPPGIRYTDFAIGVGHTIAVRSDGSAVGFGSSPFGETTIPPLPTGLSYVQADAEGGKSVLLRSDGSIVSWGISSGGGSSNQHVIPVLPPGLSYVQVAAAQWFNAALRSDGTAIAWGAFVSSLSSFRPIPALPWGVYYVEVDAGYMHLELRRSDGEVVGAGTCSRLQDLVPQLDPRTSYVQISANGQCSAARVGPRCVYVGIAPGCSGSLQATRLVPRDTPRIGKPMMVTLFDLPANLAIMAMSFQRLSTGMQLGVQGMPGCAWYVPVDACALLVGQNQQARFTLPIPYLPDLVGVHLFNQALVLDPAAGNAAGAVVSDAAEGVIGRP